VAHCAGKNVSKNDRKRQHQELMRAEIARREQARKERAPFSREEMLKLVEFVGEKVIVEGHGNDFTYTLQWLRENNCDRERAIEFLNGEKIVDDWSLCIKGDPFALFGPSQERLSWMPIDRFDLKVLLDWLDEEVPKRGCKHDMTLTTEWLKAHDCPVHPTIMALLAHGGGCDCEVVLNVEPESIYPRS